MKTVQIWTDGSVSPKNPGIRGGWGAVFSYGKIRRLVSGLYKNGLTHSITNNMMETAAITESLKILKEPCEISLYTDSKYVTSGIFKWYGQGKLHGTNKAFWIELAKVIQAHQVTPIHVNGHDGTPQNELAHKLAYFAAKHEFVIDEKFDTFLEAEEYAKQRFKEISKAAKSKSTSTG